MANAMTRRSFVMGAVGGYRLSVTGRLDASPPFPLHDSSKPYRALVMGLDNSQSLSRDQFLKCKKILQDIIARKAGPNDLLWLLDVAATAPTVSSFPVPAVTTRSEVEIWPGAVEAAKTNAATAIGDLRQTTGITDLDEPIIHALDILASHPRAIQRSLVIASDFVRDAPGAAPSPRAPDPLGDVSASGIHVYLAVAQPTENYLHRLRMSGSDVYREVKTSWSRYFSRLNASSVAIQPVDAYGLS